MTLFDEKHQPSESLPLGLLLAIVGGFLDAYTYLTRGEVFANAITGNIVLLGLHTAKGEVLLASYYLLPIAAFGMGVLIISLIQRHFKFITAIHWREIILATEIMLLFIVGLLPAPQFNTIANICVSFTCAVQISTFKKVKGFACATTMCTGNLRVGTENIFAYFTEKDKSKLKKASIYYIVILFFIIGAMIGSFACNRLGSHAVWICCVLLLLLFPMMHNWHKKYQ